MSDKYNLTRFSGIDPGYISKDLDKLLSKNNEKLQELLESLTTYNWNNLIVPLEEMDDDLNKFWSPIRHLHSVADNELLRKSYNDGLQKITEYYTDIMQNEMLYQAYKQIRNSDEYKQIDTAKQKVIDDNLQDFTLSGVGLDEEKKQQYKKIVQDLTKVESKFEENVLDATQEWSKVIEDESQLQGLPESVIELAKKNAEDRNIKGWVFTLDFPSYYPTMLYADSSELRRDLYEAYVTRASSLGSGRKDLDNSAIMAEILTLRKQKARVLGFDTYANLSLAKKMAKTPEEVLSFLDELGSHSIEAARQEYAELIKFTETEFQLPTINPWDVAYYSEKLKHQTFDFSQEEVRSYFPASSVLNGLFTIVNKLYGINIKQIASVDVWHDDVSFYLITDSLGNDRGGFYLDLYARKNKRGGAWMDECVIRKNLDGKLQIPIAFLSCNFTPPVNDKPSLLTHDEVTTLFHEFGHGLHHMLTLIDYPPVSGINGVPWDAVELPSQFMENWCWERKSLDLIGKHYLTGEPIPDTLFSKMQKAKNFQSAMQMVRQLEFAIFDFRLHFEDSDYSQQSVQQLLSDVRQKTAVIIPPEFNRFQNSFTHIFSGGYAAGYYSYKWAEVLSADAFSKFEENGIFDRETGKHFLNTILEQGGSRDALDLFVEFRGREPSIAPLLRHAGIEMQAKGQ
jgi:oligopeptidase A